MWTLFADAGPVPAVGEALIALLLDALGLGMILTAVVVRFLERRNVWTTRLLALIGAVPVTYVYSAYVIHYQFSIASLAHITALATVVIIFIDQLIAEQRKLSAWLLNQD